MASSRAIDIYFLEEMTHKLLMIDRHYDEYEYYLLVGFMVKGSGVDKVQIAV